MKNLKTYRMFESSVELTPEQVEWLDECTKKGGTWSYNPETGLVDVGGTFDCSEQGLTDFKGVKFGEVKGHFWCNRNQLTSLEGAPQNVRGGFYCNRNQLTSLEGTPQRIGGAFDCDNNQLTSLLNGPQEVGAHFNCSDNSITSLEGAPQHIWTDFYCGNNQLTSLEGAPQKVGVHFWCNDNQLTSLEGAPQRVGGNFRCNDNQLTSLEGAPQKIGGILFCGNNPVSEKILKSIFVIMETGKGYLESVEYLWPEISLDDQVLLYRPEFEWVGTDERKKLDALRAYQGFKGMI